MKYDLSDRYDICNSPLGPKPKIESQQKKMYSIQMPSFADRHFLNESFILFVFPGWGVYVADIDSRSVRFKFDPAEFTGHK